MTDRVVKGIIEKWGEVKAGFKADNVTSYAKIGIVLVGQEGWHNFFSEDGTPVQLQQLQTTAPVGSEVEFSQWQKGEYWNFKKGTFKVLSAGNGTVPAGTQPTPTAPTSTGAPAPATTGVDWDGKERRTVRQNSGRHASAYITVLQAEGHFKDKSPNEIELAFFGFAEKFEEWAYREKTISSNGFSSAGGEKEQPASEPQKVTEEIVD